MTISSGIAALLLLVSVAATAQAQTLRQEPEDLEIATAFAVTADGTFLTAAHELEGCRSVALLVQNMAPAEATSVARDARLDVALVHATLPHPVPALSLRSGSGPMVGESLFLLGYPLQQPLHFLHPSFFGTLVSGLDGIGGDPEVFRLPIVVLPGMSGSAVLDDGGYVTGMVRTHLVQTAPNNGPTLGGESFVTSGHAIASFLLSNHIATGTADKGRELRPTELAAKGLASSAAIICHK